MSAGSLARVGAPRGGVDIGLGDHLPRAFGPYTLLKQIAVGGMAEIYLAKAKGIGGFEKLLALKMIHPRFSEDDHFINMLVEEAKISVQLNHVNIGQIFDLGRIDDTYYIAMEYIEGADIFRTMRRATEMGMEVPIDSAVYVAQDVCAGLDYAHRKRDADGKPLKIIHRDISPQNVIISFAGEVKIVDFGIAKASLRAKDTEVGVIKGKYYYMSPEQAWGDPVDHRSDIFSAGIILHEILTGQMLYMEDNVPALLDRVRKADISPPSSKRAEVPAALDAIVMKALAKYPDDRYQTAHELQTALTRFLFSFSSEYTATTLAALMAWLFADEVKRPSSPPTGSIPAPTPIPQEPPPPAPELPIMIGDELADEAVVSSMIYSTEDATSVRAAARAMAALRQAAVPVHDDEETGRQQSSPAPRARAEEDDDDTAVWGDETVIDRDHKFRDIAEHYRALQLKGQAPAAEPGPDETDPTGGGPASAKRGADEETRPVDMVQAARKRLMADMITPATPAPRLVDQEETQRGPTRGSSGAVAPLPRVGPAPARGAAGVDPAPKRPPMARGIPGSRSRSETAVPAVPRASLSGAIQARITPHSPASPTLPPIAPAPRVIGRGEKDRDAMVSAATVAAPVLPITAPPPPAPPPLAPRRTSDVTTSDDSTSDDSTSGDTTSSETDGPTKAAAPLLPRRSPVGAPAPVLPGPSTVAALSTSSIETRAVPAPAAGGRPSPPGLPAVPLPGDAGAPLVHDPYTGSYMARSARDSSTRTLLWVIAAALLAIGVVVATIVLLQTPDAEPCVLEITSHPAGARVQVSDVAVGGTTPLRVEGLEAGKTYELQVLLDGYEPWRQQLQALPGVVQQIAILDAIRATLQVESTPPGAQIYIDGRYRGSTPLTVRDLEITRPLQIRAERTGFQPDQQRFEWNGRTEASVSFELRPLR